jgi:hypothetical protein
VKEKRHACCCCCCWWLPTPIYCPLRFDDDATSLKKRKEKGKTTRGTRHCAVCSRSRIGVSLDPPSSTTTTTGESYTLPFPPLVHSVLTHTRPSIRKNSLVTKRKRHYYGGECNFLGARNSKSSQKKETKQQTKLCVFLFHDWDIKQKKRETGLV